MKKLKKIMGLALIGGMLLGSTVTASAYTRDNQQDYTNNTGVKRNYYSSYFNYNYSHRAQIEIKLTYGYYVYQTSTWASPRVTASTSAYTESTIVHTYGEY